MSAQTTPSPARRSKLPLIIASVAAVIVIAAMGFDTKVVRIGTAEHIQEEGFSPETFGAEQFPIVQKSVEDRAVDAATLASDLAADKNAAIDKYGVKAGIGAVMPVSFTGVAGEAKGGIYPVTVEGVPDEITIRVQTGPAINGTDLRDATGTITFGQFKNQIEYQNAGSALNNEMKKAVLAGIDTASLSGKTISVTGVFKLINPKNWLVTPVEMSVQ